MSEAEYFTKDSLLTLEKLKAEEEEEHAKQNVDAIDPPIEIGKVDVVLRPIDGVNEADYAIANECGNTTLNDHSQDPFGFAEDQTHQGKKREGHEYGRDDKHLTRKEKSVVGIGIVHVVGNKVQSEHEAADGIAHRRRLDTECAHNKAEGAAEDGSHKFHDHNAPKLLDLRHGQHKQLTEGIAISGRIAKERGAAYGAHKEEEEPFG